MKRLIAAALAVLALALAPMAPAFANPIPYVNSPFDTPNAQINTAIANLNNNTPAYQYTVACSGTTTATCTGIRTLVSITGLTTAGTATSATMTVTDTAVTAASQINCFVSNYTGAGNPLAVDVLAAAGSFSYAIQNTHASAALNATVPTACYVYN
jgi:hypothetical protein